MYSPLSEEIDELREIVEIDLEDQEARMKLLSDPGYITRFKTMWMKGKSGFGPARWRRKLRLEDYAFRRDIDEMLIEQCPVSKWEGLSFGDVFRGLTTKTLNAGAYQDHFESMADEADFVLAMLRAFDLEIIWSTVSANRDPATIKKLLMDPLLLPGFNDSGAHLTNMAFYDCNLRALKIASEDGLDAVSYMVRRLTKDVSDIFGVDAGRIAPDQTADVIIVNPETLASYDGEAGVKRIHREEFGHEQLVNRSDGVVDCVMINGRIAWNGTEFTQDFAKVPMGRLLKAG